MELAEDIFIRDNEKDELMNNEKLLKPWLGGINER